MMLSIAIITKSLAPYRLDLYEAINDQEDSQVMVFTPKIAAYDHPWSNLDQGRGMKIIECESYAYPEILNKSLYCLGFGGDQSCGFSPTLYEKLSSENPDTVIIHEASAFVLTALFWSYLNDKPLFQSSEIGKKSGGGKMKKLNKILHSCVSLFLTGRIANSRAALSGVGLKLPTVFSPHSVASTNRILTEKKANERVRILFVGSLIQRKGLDILLKAVGLLKAEKKLVDVIVAGSGSIQPYSDICKKLAIEDCVSFSGFVEGEDLHDLYASSDIFCLPTRYDTYGVVVHEAAIFGLPLVISNAAGSAEVLVNEGVNGFSFESENYCSLYEKLLILIESPKCRVSFGRKSSAMAEKYSVGNNSLRIKKFINSFV